MPTRRFAFIFNLILMLALLLAGLQAGTAPVQAAQPGGGQTGLDVNSLVNLDGTLKHTAQSGNLDLTGWNIRLDPQSGPVFLPAAATTYGWRPVGTGSELDSYVYAVAISGTNTYVAGSFTTLTGCPKCAKIAMWDGSTWSPVGWGINTIATESIKSISIVGSDIYVAGSFRSTTQTDGTFCTDCFSVAKWDGSSWLPLGKGTNKTLIAVVAAGTDVYVAGDFTAAIQTDSTLCTTCNGIAKWNGSSWEGLGQGADGAPQFYALASDGTNIYAGGTFVQTIQADGTFCTNCNRIAKWNGTTWEGLATGINSGDVRAFAISGTKLYAGGLFSFISTCSIPVYCNRIAVWDGTS